MVYREDETGGFTAVSDELKTEDFRSMARGVLTVLVIAVVFFVGQHFLLRFLVSFPAEGNVTVVSTPPAPQVREVEPLFNTTPWGTVTLVRGVRTLEHPLVYRSGSVEEMLSFKLFVETSSGQEYVYSPESIGVGEKVWVFNGLQSVWDGDTVLTVKIAEPYHPSDK